MFGFRSCPFKEDPLEFMVACVVREAEVEGRPLTPEEQNKLRAEGEYKSEGEFEVRIQRLVRHIIERETRDGVSVASLTFSGAIEWAGDQQYPLVVQVAEHVCYNPSWLDPAVKWKRRTIDKVQLVGCAVLIVLGMFAVAMILEMTRALK